MSPALRRAALALLAALSAAALVILAVYYAHGHGRLDWTGHARGRDFVNLWTAGRLIGEGRTLQVFDPAAFMAAHHRLFAPTLPFHFWSYPPPALLLAAPFARAPGYFAALAGWTTFGLAVLAPAAVAIVRPRDGAGWARAALLWLCPATAVNIGLGQNGAVSAALLLGGLALLDARPLAAGALLGLLVFKPQLALLLPVMVLAGGRWRTTAGAAGSAAALLLLSTALFGVESWRAFVVHALPMQSQMLREGRGPFIAMMPSAFMGLRELGVRWSAALAAQAPFTLLGGWLVWRAWRAPGADPAGRAAVLCAATFIATPQSFNYDLIPTAFAALRLLRPRTEADARAGARSAAGLDAALAAVVWALPVLMLGLGMLRLPLAPLVLTALALRTAQREGVLPRVRASRASAAGEAASHT